MSKRDMKWMDRAKCKDSDPGLFDTELGVSDRAEEAKAVCRVCPVRDDCASYAAENRFPENIYGGDLPADRGIKIKAVSV